MSTKPRFTVVEFIDDNQDDMYGVYDTVLGEPTDFYSRDESKCEEKAQAMNAEMEP